MDKIKLYNDHYIIPFRKYPNQTGGICDKNKNMILESIRGHGQWGKEFTYKGEFTNIKTENKSAIFIGHMTSHYGHFLWETLSRFWIFLKLNKSFFIDKDIVFINFCAGMQCDMRNYSVLNYIMNSLDIQKYSLKKITTVTSYRKIYLPEVMNSLVFPEIQNNSYDGKKTYGFPKEIENYLINAEYQKDLFYSITKQIDLADNRELNIYITRKITSDRPTSIYDNMFKKLGFIILSPSSNSFIKDLQYYKSARIIAGIDGSGLHNVGFMQHPKRYMIELKHRKKNFLPENKGLAVGQCFFNWFNNVPYTVIPCFKLSLSEIESEIKKILTKV